MGTMPGQVLSGDGLPQEVCGVCRQNLDLSVTFKRQVSQADLMLREHLASTQETERCETPTILGDPLTEEERKAKSLTHEERVDKDEDRTKSPSENLLDIVNPSNGEQKEDDDWAVAEPWPDLAESEATKEGEAEQRTERENVNSEKDNVKENVEADTEDSVSIPLTHVKIEGGGTLLFSLSEEEPDPDENLNELELICSEANEDNQEEFKCPHCPKVFNSKRGVSGHQREHPEYCNPRRRDRKRARDRNRVRDRKTLSHRRPQQKKVERNINENTEEKSNGFSIPQIKVERKINENIDEKSNGSFLPSEGQSTVNDDDSQTDEQKDGLRRSSRSTLGKAPERHVVPHYSCTKCERMYNDEAVLENHVKMQHGISYKCNHCGKKFTLKDSLERHIRHTHLDASVPKIVRRLQQQSGLNNNQSARNNDQVRNREQTRRNHNRSRRKNGHSCDVCGKTYENRSHLFSHMRSHKSTVHLCEICGKTVSLNTYPAHKRSHLSAESNDVFPCDLCGKKFNNKISLRTHKNSYHGTLKFTCEVCGKQFTTMALMKHHQNIHSGKRDHACQLCGKAFSLKVTLKSHMRIHTGEMPYGCENCGKHFTWKTTYRNHMATCKKAQGDASTRSEVVTQNSVYSSPSEIENEVARPNTFYPPAPPVTIPPPPIPYMSHLPQELPLDYSEEAKYHAPIDYSEESKYRFLPISISDSRSHPPMVDFREDIKYPYQQPLNFSGDVKMCRDFKSPM